MEISSILKLFNIIAPLMSAFTAFVILAMNMVIKPNALVMAKRKALMYLGCAVLNWAFVFIFFYEPNTFVYINALSYVTFLMAQVFLYGFIYEITCIEGSCSFSPFHYATPVAFGIFMLALMIVVPFNEQREIIHNKDFYTGGSRLYFIMSNSKMKVRFVFSFIYIILAFVRLHRYQKAVINYSANEQKSSLRWVKALLFCSVALLFIPLSGIFFTREEQITSAITTINALILIMQYVYLCYYVPKEYFVPYSLTTACNPNDETKSTSTPLNRPTLDSFIETEKPHLDANLKITDLCRLLGVNRTYLSAFINSEYGVNFSTFINTFRLDTFRKIKSENPALGEQELADMSGFGSIQNLRRFQKKNKIKVPS